MSKIKKCNPNMNVSGGNYPQALINEMAGRIASGEIEAVLLAGAEAIANEIYAAKNNLAPDWSEPVHGQMQDRGLGLDRLFLPADIAHGLELDMPLGYSLFENGLRHRLNHSFDDHAQYIANTMVWSSPMVES